MFSHSSLMEYTLPCSHFAEEETSAGGVGTCQGYGLSWGWSDSQTHSLSSPHMSIPGTDPPWQDLNWPNDGGGRGGWVVASNHGQLA